jgi:pimeloyl-ACP methyl ester carboxylesterase
MRVAYEVEGEGAPLLLVSGLAQVGRRWRRVAQCLAPDLTVVTFDNRETGGTGPSPDGFVLADIAADALDLMSELGHERFFLGGISMGGMIAQEIIMAAPSRVRAAVLLATHGGGPDAVPPPDAGVLLPTRPVVTDADRLTAARELWTRLSGPGFAEANPTIIDEEARLSFERPTPLDGVIRQIQAIAGYDTNGRVAASGVPVAVGHGDCDPLVVYENGVALAKHLGCELVTFSGSGHGLEFERVDDVVALMRRTFMVAA